MVFAERGKQTEVFAHVDTPPAAKSTYTQHSCCFQVHVAHYVTQFRFENLSIEPAS